MHPSVLAWLDAQVREHDLAARSVLDVGSLNINGTPRDLFVGAYLGVDLRQGLAVDEIADAAALPYASQTFDVVLSIEMLEHDSAFWRSVPEMIRVLRPAGHLLLTTRGIGFPRHDYPSDYWRFTPSAIEVLLDCPELELLEITEDPDPTHPGVFGIARRKDD